MEEKQQNIQVSKKKTQEFEHATATWASEPNFADEPVEAECQGISEGQQKQA